eukprot:2354575-Prorocentrum_lima.AAC.1
MAFKREAAGGPCGLCGDAFPLVKMIESWRDEHPTPEAETLQDAEGDRPGSGKKYLSLCSH